MGVMILQSTPITNQGIDGTGQIVGIADTGIDMKSCFLMDLNVPTPYNKIDLRHRKIITYMAFADNLENYDSKPHSEDPIGHGTHVCSTVTGETTGPLGAYNGMALGSKVAFFDMAKYDVKGDVQLFPPPDLDKGMFRRLYDAGARVMSMSWGAPDSNCYSSYSAMVNDFHWDNPEALIIFAAGNSGQNGDYSVVTPSTAKNCLTVGASYNMMETAFKLENNLNYVAYFSSSGPTADGRLKPDILAPGYYITSADNRKTCDVVSSRGTSMATPVVAGNIALLRQYFMSGKYQGQPLLPSGALMKAMIVHSGKPMTSFEDAQGVLHSVTYPDNHQGYGRMELDEVLDFDNRFTMMAYGSANESDSRYRGFEKNGGTQQYTVTIVNATTKVRALKATLVWTDPPSSPGACRRNKNTVVINDLDLRIIGPQGEIIYPVTTGGKEPDRVNNVEQVIISSPLPGGNYTVEVEAHHLESPQPYALVFTGQFFGNTYNETAGHLESGNIWTTLKGLLVKHKTVLIMVAVVIGLAGWMLICYMIYRSKGQERNRLPSQVPLNPEEQQDYVYPGSRRPLADPNHAASANGPDNSPLQPERL